MAPIVNLVHQSENGLNQERWRFYYFDNLHALVLVGWARETRPTKRHKFQAVRSFDAYGRKSSIEREMKPELPDFIKVEALQKFTESLHVMPWIDK